MVYIARASSRFAAALRGGALRAARSRACLGTACLGGEFIKNMVHRRATLFACHPRTCPEDPYNVTVDPRDKPEGDNPDVKT